MHIIRDINIYIYISRHFELGSVARCRVQPRVDGISRSAIRSISSALLTFVISDFSHLWKIFFLANKNKIIKLWFRGPIGKAGNLPVECDRKVRKHDTPYTCECTLEWHFEIAECLGRWRETGCGRAEAKAFAEGAFEACRFTPVDVRAKNIRDFSRVREENFKDSWDTRLCSWVYSSPRDADGNRIRVRCIHTSVSWHFGIAT